MPPAALTADKHLGAGEQTHYPPVTAFTATWYSLMRFLARYIWLLVLRIHTVAYTNYEARLRRGLQYCQAQSWHLDCDTAKRSWATGFKSRAKPQTHNKSVARGHAPHNVRVHLQAVAWLQWEASLGRSLSKKQLLLIHCLASRSYYLLCATSSLSTQTFHSFLKKSYM